MAEINITLFNKRRTAELAARIRDNHDQIAVMEPEVQQMAEDIEQNRARGEEVASQLEALDTQLTMAENIRADIEARLAQAKKPVLVNAKKKVKGLDITALVVLAVALVAIGALVLTYFLLDSAERNIILELICVGGVALITELIVGIIRGTTYRRAKKKNRTAVSEYEQYMSKQRMLLDEQMVRIAQFSAKREELIAEQEQIGVDGEDLVRRQALKAKECESLKAELERLYADCISAPDYRNIEFVDFLTGVLRSDLVDSLRDAIFLYEKNNKYNELMQKLDALLLGEFEEE